jgi:hypothetical protein
MEKSPTYLAKSEPARAAKSPWRFSLRGLLLAVTAVAVLVGLAAAVRSVWVGAVLFAILSAAPVVVLGSSGRRAYLLAYAAVYGPFYGMASYTYFFVACGHCKATTWTMLPHGPGLIATELVRYLLDLPAMWRALDAGLGVVVSAAMVAALAVLVYGLGRVWGAIALATVMLGCAYFAVVMLAMIRA